MSDQKLRNQIIRLAHDNPELRDDLLPLISKKAWGAGDEWKHQREKITDEFWELLVEVNKLMRVHDLELHRDESTLTMSTYQKSKKMTLEGRLVFSELRVYDPGSSKRDERDFKKILTSLGLRVSKMGQDGWKVYAIVQ